MEVVGEGEAVAPGELDATQDVGRAGVGVGEPCDREDPLDGVVEPCAGGRQCDRAGVAAAAGADDQGVVELAGVDADDGEGGLGPLALLEGLHDARSVR